MKIGVKKLHPDAKLPERQTPKSVGADLYAYENRLVGAGETIAIKTGIALELPAGFEAQIRPRSGLAAKHNITVQNTPGTIDEDYKGEVLVLLHNSGHEYFQVCKFDRVAQLIIAPAFYPSFEEVQEVGTSERGAGGLGSTGR